MEKMKAGETTELEETLAWLADNTAMTLAALSSTSLLDRRSRNAVPQTMLDEMITGTGFVRFNLSNIMRSSQNIAAATSPASFNELDTLGYKIPEIISPETPSDPDHHKEIRCQQWRRKECFQSPSSTPGERSPHS